MFKVGDRVRIKTLHANGITYFGKVGRVGIISTILKLGGPNFSFYRLHPFCDGGSWPAECLEYAEQTLDDRLQNAKRNGVNLSPETINKIKQCNSK